VSRSPLKILVTGARGWVGRSAIQVITEKYNEFEIVGTSRLTGTLEINIDYRIPLISNEEALNFCQSFDGVIHTSFPTQNYVEELGELVYRQQANEMNSWFSAFLSELKSGFVFVVSSGAVALMENQQTSGDVYAELKAQEEKIVMNESPERFAIGRLWAASGRFMRNYQIYALGQFIESGLLGRDIYINSPIETYRRYCDTEQFCEVGLQLAMDGFNSTFDSGGVKVSIQTLAELIASRYPRISVRHGSQGRKSRQPNDYFPTSDQFELLAKEMGLDLFSIDDQVDRTILAVKNVLKAKGGIFE